MCKLYAWAYLRVEVNKYLYIREGSAIKHLGAGPPEYSGDIRIYKLYNMSVCLDDDMGLST
jgi:hypothetical protein